MRLLLLALLLASAGASAQATGEIAGRVLDANTLEPLIGAAVRLAGTQQGAAANIDGDYSIMDVPAGTYTLVVSYVGYVMQTILEVEVKAGKTRRLDTRLPMDDFPLSCCVVCYAPPLINASSFASRIVVGDGIDPPGDEDPCCPPAGAVYAGG